MPLDLTNPIELTVSQAVLALENNDGRFENFCRDVVSLIEGNAIIFSTSKSWDLGRDGVGAGTARGVYVCVSLRDDVDDKTLTDLQRITSTTARIERLYFCSSQRLSEHRITLLESQLASETDNAFPITCLGATQLTEATAVDPSIVERFYAPEIQGALRAISSEPSDETEIRGLRLALVAAAGDNSSDIRLHLYSGALIDVLSDGAAKTITACAKAISERLHLAYIISDTAIRPQLERLLSEGLVEPLGRAFKLAPKGVKQAELLRIQAAERFLEGRLAIRKAIEESIGEKLAEDNFHQIWAIFEERIASHFHARGAAMVAEVSAIMNDAPDERVPQVQSQMSFLNELATAVANTSSHAQRRDELHQAVTDLFMDRTSGATDWLVRVCASFVACCALGLEHSSGAALSRLFARTALVLDSDVALSLLGEGEPEHEGVFTIASKWTKVGGKVLIAEPVLEEVAYHAHIAQHDFEQLRQLLPGSAEDRLHIIDNVFVRSFAEHMAMNGAAISQWSRFISQFRGQSSYDWQRVAGHLRAEYSIGTLPPRSTAFEALERKVRDFLIRTAEQRGFFGKTVRDKATRDARLYAQMVHYLQSVRATDPGATCLLVSSAHRLAEAEEAFHESGEQQIVVPISTVLHLLSLLPQVSLGLRAMKAFLFEERRPGFSSDLERTILRLVRSSQEFSMPWAKRGALMREVRDRLIDDARKQGRYFPDDASTSGLERQALAEENKDRTVQLLAEALDKVVVRTRVEDENTRLRQENERLRQQLQLAKSKPARRK
jgi:hypothetical protein